MAASRLLEDDRCESTIYVCHQGHVHVLFRNTNISMMPGDFQSFHECVQEGLRRWRTRTEGRSHLLLRHEEGIFLIPNKQFEAFAALVESARQAFEPPAPELPGRRLPPAAPDADFEHPEFLN